MTEREVLKLALEAFEWNYNTDLDNIPAYEKWAKMLKENITAIREALAQSEQEPVAWANLNALSEQINSVNCGTVYRLPSEAEKRQPLYTTPPQPEPVIDKSAAIRIATSLGWEPKRKPLTDEQIMEMYNEPRSDAEMIAFARAIEAAHGIWPENSDCHGPDWTDRDGEYLK